MNITICDICNRVIEGLNPNKEASMRPEDLFGSRTFTVFNPNDIANDIKTLTLCTTCKETMYYYMENHDALKRAVESQTLGNRLRFLLKKPMKNVDECTDRLVKS